MTVLAPMSPRARRRVELSQIRYELTDAGRRELGAALTPRELAQAAIRACLRPITADELVDAHLDDLRSRGVRPPANVVSRARLLVRRLMQERARRRGRFTSTPTEACR